MILKSIVLNGFKSFGKKTVLDISKNVTGIVGPNGSGKSNIVEAIRFVMGEQSMKNIRSKSLSDLIHKGEQNISRASVSIIIDNKEKIYNENINPDIATFLAYDEISLTREIYKDGLSQYKINDALVRLKDIQEILALAGIGQSVHTIISQGEADKILSSSPEDRKTLIADAIGLKVLENRLKESSKKLEKTDKHIETANLLRREMAPELREMKSLVEKINDITEIRSKLRIEYIKFFLFESKKIEDRKNKIREENNIEEEIKVLEVKIKESKELILDLELKSDILNQKKQNEENVLRNEVLNKEREKSVLAYEKNIILNKIKSEIKVLNINKSEFVDFKNNILQKLNEIEAEEITTENSENIFNKIKNYILEIKNIINTTNLWHDDSIDSENLNKEILSIEDKINLLNNDINALNQNILEIKNRDHNEMLTLRNIYNEDKNLELKLKDKISKRDFVLQEMRDIQEIEDQFGFYLKESEIFLGENLSMYKDYEYDEFFIKEMLNYSQYDNKRSIEKCKIKIEEIGVIDVGLIKNSYEILFEKDEHLKKEILDLEDARIKIIDLIEDLKVKISEEFQHGLVKINELFDNYFREIFSGGSASLEAIKIQKRKKLNDDEDAQFENLENEEENIGIDININLPVKKVKDINMLSGGEKTLLSISLLFALTTLNTPPFMVLDETDAALDESNAKKYGKLLQRLAVNSRLLVVTHNRETMNKADVLYGITMGGDGCSRILSIKFED